MFRILAQLQKKPEQEKRAIALGLAGGITFFIVVLWLMGISLYSAPAAEVVATGEQGPASAVSESVGSFWSDITRTFGELKRAVTGAPESFKVGKDTN